MLKITDLKCGYGDKFHISGITLDAARGDFTGIIGPNGSGKTTLLRGITGELRIEYGSIVLDGKSIDDYTLKEKARKLAVVSQEIENAPITVEDYVLMGRLPYMKPMQFFESNEDHEIADRYMELTGVSTLRNKFLYQLSGGEKQLAAIARALTQEPLVLLLDEPTSHLDITHQMQILNLIQGFRDDPGLTVVMIIHDLNLAGEFCDHLVMMQDGGIYTTGAPEDVLTYENIEQVYQTVVVTKTNPLSGKPVIFPVSRAVLEK